MAAEAFIVVFLLGVMVGAACVGVYPGAQQEGGNPHPPPLPPPPVECADSTKPSYVWVRNRETGMTETVAVSNAKNKEQELLEAQEKLESEWLERYVDGLPY